MCRSRVFLLPQALRSEAAYPIRIRGSQALPYFPPAHASVCHSMKSSPLTYRPPHTIQARLHSTHANDNGGDGETLLCDNHYHMVQALHNGMEPDCCAPQATYNQSYPIC